MLDKVMYFLSQVHESFKAWTMFPRESLRIVTQEGHYVSDYLGRSDEGKLRLAAVPFLQTNVPAWEQTFFDDDGNMMTEEEFQAKVQEVIQDLIDKGALDEDDLMLNEEESVV